MPETLSHKGKGPPYSRTQGTAVAHPLNVGLQAVHDQLGEVCDGSSRGGLRGAVAAEFTQVLSGGRGAARGSLPRQ